MFNILFRFNVLRRSQSKTNFMVQNKLTAKHKLNTQKHWYIRKTFSYELEVSKLNTLCYEVFLIRMGWISQKIIIWPHFFTDYICKLLAWASSMSPFQHVLFGCVTDKIHCLSLFKYKKAYQKPSSTSQTSGGSTLDPKPEFFYL